MSGKHRVDLDFAVDVQVGPIYKYELRKFQVMYNTENEELHFKLVVKNVGQTVCTVITKLVFLIPSRPTVALRSEPYSWMKSRM